MGESGKRHQAGEAGIPTSEEVAGSYDVLKDSVIFHHIESHRVISRLCLRPSFRVYVSRERNELPSLGSNGSQNHQLDSPL